MGRRSLALVALAAGCGLFPDTSGLSGGVPADADASPLDAPTDAPIDARVDAPADVAVNDAPSGPPHVAGVWNNIDASDTPGPSLAVPISSTPGDALLACVREGSNDTDAFTIADDAKQTWTQIKSGYESVNLSSRMSCFWVAQSAPVSAVTVNFTTPGGATVRSMTVLEIAGANATSFEDASIGDGVTSDGVGSSLASGVLSTTSPNDLLVYYVGLGDDVTTWTADTGYAIPNNAVAPGISGSNVRTALSVEIVSSIQSGVSTSMSWSPTLSAGHSEMGIFLAIRGA